MNTSKKIFSSIDEYILEFPPDVQKILNQIRATIKKAAPKTTELISYGMPAFKQNKVLVYFAVNKSHIGFYPTTNPIKVFSKELESFKTSKGAIQFPFDKKIPLNLITKIVKYRKAEDMENTKNQKRK